MAWRARISRQLQETRWLYCNDSLRSAPIRNYINKHYDDLKTLNPQFRFLMRPSPDDDPRIVCQYGYGHFEVIDCENKTDEEITAALEAAVWKGNEWPIAWPVEDDMPDVVVPVAPMGPKPVPSQEELEEHSWAAEKQFEVDMGEWYAQHPEKAKSIGYKGPFTGTLRLDHEFLNENQEIAKKIGYTNFPVPPPDQEEI